MQLKPFSFGLALILGAASLALVLHYPLTPVVMGAVAVACLAAGFARLDLWLLILPALLPVIGLAPWSGWLTFEELDILILAVAASGYARLAWPSPGQHTTGSGKHRQAQGIFLRGWLLAGLFALATAVSISRGFVDAGGFAFGWYQGYHEPMNSVRVGKSFFLALLLVPLWQVASTQNPQRAQNLLSLGLMLGLAAAAFTTIWERLAFTGLLNFSTDYRTTGLFWEMHVGGAALDGFLVLTVPFAVRELAVARSTMRWGLAAGVLMLAAYACLTTFSRGVYLAVPVGLLVYFVLTGRNGLLRFAHNDESDGAQGRSRWESRFVGLLLVASFGVGAAWMFQSSGYRGMAGLLGTVALMLPLSQVLRGLRGSKWLVGLVMGMLLIMATIAITMLLPKGAYVAWALATVFTAVMLWRDRRGTPSTSSAGAMAFGGFLATVASTALVARNWGESAGLRHATPVLLAVLAVGAVAALWRRPLWPASWRWQATAAGTMGLAAALVGVMGGGAYMGDRFATGSQDFGGRLGHWQLGLNMLNAPADLWLGKGPGRFAANYSLTGNLQDHAGDYRLGGADNNRYLTLTGGLQVGATPLRVMQRVAPPGKQATVTARVRASADVALGFEVCEKHLLYAGACNTKAVRVKGAPGVWQDVRVDLLGAEITRGAWYAPRWLAFSVAVNSTGGQVDLDDVALADADGRQMLANSDFSGEMAHWFFTSDRNHLPWHAKNMALNVLFDQGVIGLALWLLLFGGALWRLSFGQAGTHVLAPALAAALVGFAVVGLFDSLLDVPRVAWLFYLLLLVALGLPRGLATHCAAPATASRAQTGTSMKLPPSNLGLVVVLVCAAGMLAPPAWARVIQVGPAKQVKTIAEAARLAGDDDVVEIASGTYRGDVAVWLQKRLTIRGVGQRPVLEAAGRDAEGKAIWVFRNGDFKVSNIEFRGARVADGNGAGIRFEKGKLHVMRCAFIDNQNGILTANFRDAQLVIEDSLFAQAPKQQRPLPHLLYAGSIGLLRVVNSRFHGGYFGHLLKSRARVSDIRYNLLVDGVGGSASYEAEFPNGGDVTLVGNVIGQSSHTENLTVLAYGAEGDTWPESRLKIVHNTFYSEGFQPAWFLRVFAEKFVTVPNILTRNNLLAGVGVFTTNVTGQHQGNFFAPSTVFGDPAVMDFTLTASSWLRGRVDPLATDLGSLQPKFEQIMPGRVTAIQAPAEWAPGAVQASTLEKQ